MTSFTNLSGEKNKTIQTVHESGISFATWKCQVLMHFNEILMHCPTQQHTSQTKASPLFCCFLTRITSCSGRCVRKSEKYIIVDSVNEAQIITNGTEYY